MAIRIYLLVDFGSPIILSHYEIGLSTVLMFYSSLGGSIILSGGLRCLIASRYTLKHVCHVCLGWRIYFTAVSIWRQNCSWPGERPSPSSAIWCVLLFLPFLLRTMQSHLIFRKKSISVRLPRAHKVVAGSLTL